MPKGDDLQSRNIRNVLIDGLGVGFASAAAPFLPILLARLGASDFAVGLLSAMPAFAGLLLALPVSRFLARQPQVAPWYSSARLLVILGYAFTAFATFLAPGSRVTAILLIWALLTLPQTLVDVTFTVVMAGVAGPDRRFYLMSRRWSSLGITTAVTIAIAGFALDRLSFPLDYQIVFPVLALGGFLSFFSARQIQLKPAARPGQALKSGPGTSLRSSFAQVRKQSKFLRFTASQFVYRIGLAWALPLFPLFYVHTLRADDAQIGIINTVNSAVLLVAYFMWSRISRRRGVRFALLVTTGAIGLYPIVLSLTTNVGVVVLLAGLAGIFAAGIDLVFFDTLVSSYPPESSALFVGWYQITVYVATFVAPLVGTGIAQLIGIPGSLAIAGAIRLAGFALFARLVKG
jgi:MFS-type transporter involved in bile tolerance (Atg22 family)